MLFNKIIFFTIFVSFILFEHVEIGIAHDVITKQLIGKWHTIATIDQTFQEHTNICNIKTITQGLMNHTIDIVDETGTNETIYKYHALGKISNSQLHLVYSIGDEVHEVTYNVASYDNGDGLILQDKQDKMKRFIWQATPNATELEETKAEFEKQSAKLGMDILYFETEHCD